MIRPVIHVEAGRKMAEPGKYAAAVDGLPFKSSLFLARSAWHRVGRHGRPKRAFRGYARRSKVVSPRYPVRGGKIGPSGAQYFAPGQLHAGVRPGSFWVSGGTWGGLTARVFSRRIARHEFRGRSEGQGMAMSSSRNEPYFDKRGKPRPKKVSNALKAATVLRATGVHMLDPTVEEYRGLSRVAVTEVAGAVEAAMAVDLRWHAKDQSALARVIGAGGLSVRGGLSSVIVGRIGR